MRIDALTVDRQLRELLLHRLLLVQAGLPSIEQRRTNHHIGELQIALYESEGRIAMQRRAYERGRLGMTVKQYVFPRDQHIIENHQRVDLIEAIAQRVVGRRRAACEARATDELEIR